MKYFTVLAVFALSGCCTEKDEDIIVTDPLYENCCGANPVVLKKKDSNGYETSHSIVYLPNVFTPHNQDGKNDVFSPQFENSVTELEEFQVSANNTFVYTRRRVFAGDFSSVGWDGRLPNGEFHKGAFTYYIDFRVDQTNYRAFGSACAVECGAGTEIFKLKTTCFFGLDGDGGGGVTNTQPIEIVENVDCFR